MFDEIEKKLRSEFQANPNEIPMDSTADDVDDADDADDADSLDYALDSDDEFEL